ncbi:MAG: DUF86 domain-containing protein [Alphaproteobacteria bacterium]|nr:DUF86 domain-containing protein [Alphaproteobacteria bacterium]
MTSKRASVPADHILDAIRNIEADLAGLDAESFARDRRAVQLVERNLEIISEASRRLPSEQKDREKVVPWAAIAGIGNVEKGTFIFSAHLG